MKKGWIAAGLAVGAAFFWLGVVRLDPDFGWHMRLGEYIWQQGVPKTDPLSYTMANFPFVDHEWVTNFLMYWSYRIVGKEGLAVGAAAAVLLAIVVAVPGKWRKWAGLPAFLALSIWWPRAGVRPQIMDWVLLPLVIRLVGEEETWRRWKWILPAVMLVWANLHGGFVVGLAVAGTVFVVKRIEDRKWKLEDILVLVISGLVTLINPYGIRLWGEVWQQMSDRKVGKIIAEWEPFYAEVELGWVFLVAWTGTLMWRFRNRIEKWKIVVVAGTFLASVSSLRHGALFAVAAMPVAAEFTEMMYQEFKRDKVAVGRLRKFYAGMTILAGAILVMVIGFTVFNPGTKLAEGYFYPGGAIVWLKNNGVKGNLYTDYGWGGYMDWKLPEERIFIDGRMATWKWKSPDPKYGDYVFDEYLDIAYRGKWEKWVEKYGVETMVLPRQRTWLMREWLTTILRRIGVNLTVKPAATGLAEELEKAGWDRVYQDEAAVIYERP